MRRIVSVCKKAQHIKCHACRTEVEKLIANAIQTNWLEEILFKLEKCLDQPCQCVDIVLEEIAK